MDSELLLLHKPGLHAASPVLRPALSSWARRLSPGGTRRGPRGVVRGTLPGRRGGLGTGSSESSAILVAELGL